MQSLSVGAFFEDYSGRTAAPTAAVCQCEGVRQRKQADCKDSQVCCSGCAEVAPHSMEAVLAMGPSKSP